MAKFSTDGKYMKHQELPDGDTMVTITRYAQEVLENNGQKQKKWVLYFQELEKGLALALLLSCAPVRHFHKTLCKILGSDDMDEWIGQKILLYVKDDVEFGGEMVSAIRVRNKKVA